jgi:hypothetical protein
MLSKQIKLLCLILGCVSLVCIAGVLYPSVMARVKDVIDVTIFEDGSYIVEGCIPFNLCGQ